MLASGTPLLAQDEALRAALDNLVTAYPNALAGHDAKVLHWRDGTVMPLSDGIENKPFPELIRHASVIDQFRIPYPRGRALFRSPGCPKPWATRAGATRSASRP
jgi:hypothetical protein